MVSGTPFIFNKTVIIDTLKKNKGKAYKSAKEIGCHYETLKKYIDSDQELTQLLREFRYSRDESLLDSAEDTLQDALDGRTGDMANALKSAFYVLNNKGKARGYIPPNFQAQDLQTNAVTPDQINKAIDANKSN